MRLRYFPIVVIVLAGLMPGPSGAGEPPRRSLEDRFADVVKPFLSRYCLGCHGERKKEAKLDLGVYPSVAEVARDHRVWELVSERLDAEEMPPEEAKRKPGAAERRAVIEWIGQLRDREARRNAGDPGPGAGSPAEQRGIRSHDPRPDGRRHPADARVPRGPRERGGVRQLGRIPGDVAGPAQEVPGGGAAGRRPPGADAGRIRLRAPSGGRRHRPRQVLRPADHRLLPPARGRLRRLLPRRLAVPASRRAGQAAGGPGRLRPRGRPEPEVPGHDLDGPDRTRPGRRPDRSPSCGRCGRSCRPTPRRPTEARRGCERMRDAVIRLRKAYAPRVPDIQARGISKGSQPFVLWRNRELAAHRMRYPGDGHSPDAPELERFCAVVPRHVLRDRSRPVLRPEERHHRGGC